MAGAGRNRQRWRRSRSDGGGGNGGDRHVRAERSTPRAGPARGDVGRASGPAAEHGVRGQPGPSGRAAGEPPAGDETDHLR